MDWFVWNIYAIPKHRRQGVAGALLQEAIKQAKQAGIHHLLGSCVNTPAHLFWFKHGFGFVPYGQSGEEPGIYAHMISLRSTPAERIKQANYQIVQANKTQLHCIFDEHILHGKAAFFHDKWEDISGLAAVNADGDLLGIIATYDCALFPPLRSTQRMIPYISFARNTGDRVSAACC